MAILTYRPQAERIAAEIEAERQIEQERAEQPASPWPEPEEGDGPYFSNAQQAVFDVLVGTKENVLLTGIAGCGKSTVIRAFIRHEAERVEELRVKAAMGSIKLSPEPIIVAPTGIAALNVGGSTIHRMFGIRPDFDITKPIFNRKQLAILAYAHCIIVDEVSMVRADLFHMMDLCLQEANGNRRPFGGTRMILVGDPYQLPPVVTSAAERKYLAATYGSEAGWFFLAPQFHALEPRVFYLQESFRQTEGSFISLLNRVRDNDKSVVPELNAVAKDYEQAPDTAPWVCSYKNDAEIRNYKMLRELGTEIAEIPPDLSGDTSTAPKELLASVELAIGARVMITRNASAVHPVKPEYVNGSLGWVRNFEAKAYVWEPNPAEPGRWIEKERDAIRIELDDGRFVNVPAFEWEIIKTAPDAKGVLVKTRVGSVTQYPLALAWAITVHKAQGQGFPEAVIHLGEKGAFAHGQAYVALSRLTSAEGLYLRAPLQKGDLRLDKEVPAFLAPYARGA